MRSLFEFGRSLLPRSPSRQLQLEQDVVEEIQFHLDRRTEANLECGMSEEEARRSALEQFGDVESILDACVEARDTNPGRRAARLIAKVLPVGVACGFLAAVLIVLYALVIRLPATYPPDSNWVVVWWKHTQTGFTRSDSSVDDFETWKRDARVAEFVAIGTYRPVVSRFDDRSERLMGKYVAGDYLEEHGVLPTIGRTFRGDTTDTAERPILISYQLWDRRFDRSPNVIGSSLDVGGVNHTIVGVADKDYQTYYPFDFFAPLDLSNVDHSTRRYLVSARLKPGVTIQDAQRDLASLRSGDDQNPGWEVFVRLPQEVYGGGYPRRLIPYGVLALMLLGLTIVKSRSRPIARTWSDVPTALVGVALVGILTAFGTTGLLRNTVLAGVDQRFNFGLDAPLVLGLFSILATAVLLTGFPPKLKSVVDASRQLSHPDRPFSVSLVLTNAIAFLMLVSAVTLTHEWWQRRSPEVGFDADRLFTVQLLLPDADFGDRATRRAFFQAAIDELDRLESIEQYSFTNGFPTLTEAQGISALLPDPTDTGEDAWTRMGARAVGFDYFETVGIKILAGTPFRAEPSADRVGMAVINAAMAARFWPDGSAIGQRIKIHGVEAPFEITAVVDNAVSHRPGDQRDPILYPLVWHWTTPQMIVVRSVQDFHLVATQIEGVIRSVKPAATVGEAVSGNTVLKAATDTRAVTAALFWFFAFVALVLSSSFTFRSVRQTANKGIRLLSLKRPGHAFRQATLRQLFAGVAASLVVGGLLSMPMSQLLESELSPNPKISLLCIAIPAILLVAMHALVAYIPLRRFLRVYRSTRMT